MTTAPGIPMWRESDGTQVWLVGGEGRGPIADLADREARAAAEAEPGAVLGANADADDRARLSQLVEHGYVRELSVVELERDTTPLAMPTPADIETSPASPGDAEAMHELTQVVWAGRAYFVAPTVDDYRAWIQDGDAALILLARRHGSLVGYIEASEHPHGLEIEDLQVHPRYQRQGIATHLFALIVSEARRRGVTRLFLETEGDNPAGARDFYEARGFTLARENLRFRKRARGGPGGA